MIDKIFEVIQSDVMQWLHWIHQADEKAAVQENRFHHSPLNS